MAKDGAEVQWCFSQVKGTLDEDLTEADIVSTVEFNHDGELLATGDKGGRIVIFQKEEAPKGSQHYGEYNVYSTFQSHEPEFDYLKSLEIEEKINKIKWLKRRNASHFLLSTNDKTVKLWKISERCYAPCNFNLRDDQGVPRSPEDVTTLRVPIFKPSDLVVEASPRRVYANAHTYHINSISLNSDDETYLSADDLRINLWHLGINDQSYNIVDIKPANMEELTEVITAAEFHPIQCSMFAYSSSKGTVRLCDMRESALCDRHSKMFEEPEDPGARSFFSEIISSISDVRFSHNGRYMLTRDYLTVKVWDLNMENKPMEVYNVHDYLRSKLCSLYENDCIFDKFECVWNGNDGSIMTGSYNNFFHIFDRNDKTDICLEASREFSKPRQILKPRRVAVTGKRKKDDITVECLDFNHKILHTAWHPQENIIAVAATNNFIPDQEHLHVVWGFSKDFGLSGIPSAVIHSRNEEVLCGLDKIINFHSIPSITQLQLTSIISDLDWLDNVFIPTNHIRLRECHGIVCEFLQKMKIPFLKRGSGLYVWVYFGEFVSPSTREGEIAFCQKLLDEGLYINPGCDFHCTDPGWFRIIFSKPPDTLKVAFAKATSTLIFGWELAEYWEMTDPFTCRFPPLLMYHFESVYQRLTDRPYPEQPQREYGIDRLS